MAVKAGVDGGMDISVKADVDTIVDVDVGVVVDIKERVRRVEEEGRDDGTDRGERG